MASRVQARASERACYDIFYIRLTLLMTHSSVSMRFADTTEVVADTVVAEKW